MKILYHNSSLVNLHVLLENSWVESCDHVASNAVEAVALELAFATELPVDGEGQVVTQMALNRAEREDLLGDPWMKTLYHCEAFLTVNCPHVSTW